MPLFASSVDINHLVVTTAMWYKPIRCERDTLANTLRVSHTCTVLHKGNVAMLMTLYSYWTCTCT